ncbi:MAG: VPLPA-CTERM sorting domain-containing protein [Desulfobaccales bacterium]
MGLMTYNDLWNISPNNPAGNQIDSYSLTIGDPGFGPTRTFGYSGAEGDSNYNTIFADGQTAGEVKYIEWHTATDITLYGVNLFASLDWNYGDPGRAISNFSLSYSLDQGQSWIPIIDNFATLVGQNDQGRYTVADLFWARGLAAGFSFAPVTASYFQAGFTQLTTSGARICELDAVVVPLPGAVWLLGSGLMGWAGWRRFRKN